MRHPFRTDRTFRIRSVAAAVVLAASVGGCGDLEPGDDRTRVAEDPAEGVETSALPERARGLLATDRPWRAARVMERYLSEAPDPAPAERLLAARAEAGWGAWVRALELLESVPSEAVASDPVALWLLGRSRDETGDAEGAVEAYRTFLALSPPAGELQAERSAARLRLGLALLRTGDESAAGEVLEEARGTAGEAARWLGLLEADARARTGDTAAVRRATAGYDDGIPGLWAWRARVEAARNVGDEAAARELANRARAWAGTDGTRAEFLVSAGRSARAMGDEAAARDAFRAAIDRTGAAGPWARAAADALADTSAAVATPADRLAVARVHAAQGLHEDALDGFRAWLGTSPGARGGDARPNAVRMEYARSLFYAEHYDEVDDVLAPLSGNSDADFLLARAASHRDDTDRAVAIYLRLARAHAGTGTGRRALFLAAGTRQDAGSDREARELYGRVLDRYPGSSEWGHAVMRLAGMAFLDGDFDQASDLWDRYRTRYPSGSSAAQATYWAGRAREEAGDSAGAATLFRAVREAERDGYYGLVASRRLGEPFWPLPMTAAPAADADAERRVEGWMAGIDLLAAAGFPEAAAAEAERVASGAGRDRPVRYALAEALAERGYTQRAILLGLGLDRGTPDPRLLRILYPFPYRTLVTEEAREREIDPYVVAALVRQESMFEARITSHVGARGLMQIMPATGRELAREAGIEPWDAEALYHPEINVHLGTGLLAAHLEAYDGSLPSVFSAYNAGPHRVEWWSEFPSYGHEELFTERIPYSETRGYVKILTRNRALYAGLYGGEKGMQGEGSGGG